MYAARSDFVHESFFLHGKNLNSFIKGLTLRMLLILYMKVMKKKLKIGAVNG